MHALFLLLFILVAAPLASYIPLASLAGVLAIVAWNMIEKHAFVTLVKASRGDAAVLMTTFALTIFRDLTEAIVVGFALGSVLFIYRMSKTTAVETHIPFVAEDKADDEVGIREPYNRTVASDPAVVIYRISGAFFFGAAASIGSVLDRIGDSNKALIIDFSAVPFLDSTAASTLEGLAHKVQRQGSELYFSGTSSSVRKDLASFGLTPPLVRYETSVENAMAKFQAAKLEAQDSN